MTLELENHEVWRELVVPVSFTFFQLHKAIQTAFGWQNFHLHEFYILSKDDLRPRMNLVGDAESLGYKKDIPMKLDKDAMLADFIPARMKYIYDFGDHWIHDIVVEQVIENDDRNYPVCLNGKGNTPPEDVGGEPGFEEFLKIIADVNHPDHQTMIDWARAQGYKEFNLLMINSKLKS